MVLLGTLKIGKIILYVCDKPTVILLYLSRIHRLPTIIISEEYVFLCISDCSTLFF